MEVIAGGDTIDKLVELLVLEEDEDGVCDTMSELELVLLLLMLLLEETTELVVECVVTDTAVELVLLVLVVLVEEAIELVVVDTGH